MNLKRALQEPYMHLIGALVTFFIPPPHRAASEYFSYYLREPPGRSSFYTTSASLPDVQSFTLPPRASPEHRFRNNYCQGAVAFDSQKP